MADERDDRPVSTTFEGAAGTERFDSRFEWTPEDRPARPTAYFAAALPYAVGSVLAVGIVVLLVSNAAAVANVDGGAAAVDPSALNPFDDGETDGGELGAATPAPTDADTATATPTEPGAPADAPTPTATSTPPPVTPTPTPTATPTPTPVPVLDNATTETDLDPGSGGSDDGSDDTPTPTDTEESDDTPTDTETDTSTPTPTPEQTPTPTEEPTPEPTPTQEPTPEPTETETDTPSDEPIFTISSQASTSSLGQTTLWLWSLVSALGATVVFRRRR